MSALIAAFATICGQRGELWEESEEKTTDWVAPYSSARSPISGQVDSLDPGGFGEKDYSNT